MSHRLYYPFLQAVQQLGVIMDHKHSSATEWCKRVRAWAIHVSTYFGSIINTCIYLHSLAVHAYRWWPLNTWSSYGMERVNYHLKRMKANTKRDPLPDNSVTQLSADGALRYITDSFNTLTCLPTPTTTKRLSSTKKPRQADEIPVVLPLPSLTRVYC